MQPRLRHEREESERFQRHGFTAGVRTGHDQRVIIARAVLTDQYCDGHDGFFVEQRMTRAVQLDAALFYNTRSGSVEPERQLRLCEDERQFGDVIVVAADDIRGIRTVGGQLGKDTLDLVRFAALQLAQLVVCLHNRQRLDEHRRARRRCVVDKTLDFVFILCFNGNHIAPVAHGDDVVLQKFTVSVALHIFLQRVADAV